MAHCMIESVTVSPGQYNSIDGVHSELRGISGRAAPILPAGRKGRSGLSGYVDMFASPEPNAVHVAESLLDWFSRHAIANMWVTDCGTHFVNNVIPELRLRKSLSLF